MIKTHLVILVLSAYVNLATPTANCAGTFDTWCLSCDGTDCGICAKGYLNSGRCLPLANPILHCLVGGTSATTCGMCAPGYHPNNAKTEC
jgi:hypothetical protein